MTHAGRREWCLKRKRNILPVAGASPSSWASSHETEPLCDSGSKQPTEPNLQVFPAEGLDILAWRQAVTSVPSPKS